MVLSFENNICEAFFGGTWIFFEQLGFVAALFLKFIDT